MNIILLGAPGAGKGTQAQIICERFEIPSISTGALMREAMRNGTPLGEKAKAYVEKGELVPDDVVIGLIRDRLSQDDCAGGFILDGFPRTIAQAEALDAMGVVIDRVLYIKVDDQVIIDRLGGRRVCKDCGATYHIVSQPSSAGEFCDHCGGSLIVRKDDRPETIRQRLVTYHEQTLPLADYYSGQGKLREIDGGASIEATTESTLRALEE